MPGPELFYEAGDSPEALCLLSQALLPSRFLKEIIHYSLKDPQVMLNFQSYHS